MSTLRIPTVATNGKGGSSSSGTIGNCSNNNSESPQQHSSLAHQDAGVAEAIGYMREFSDKAATYHQLKTEESLVYLHRSIALLGTKVQPHYFAPTPGNLELARFFMDLHALTSSALDGECEVVWACVALVRHCSRNLEARVAIVEKFCFVPLLSFLLKKTEREERVYQLLVLLQDLTYGIHIAWEEPYLPVVLEHLVDIVHNVEGDGDGAQPTAHALLALSILVNLCYKNFVVLFLFLRSVNISSFCKRIMKYGLLAYKMLIILSEDVHAFEQRELHTFLRTCFAGIEDCLKNWNVAQLRHIVDYLLDSQSHAGLHQAMLSHSHYCEDVEKLLDQIDSRSTMDDSHEDTRKHQQICLDLVFRLISYILDLSDEQSNVISLDAITPRLYEMLGEWLVSDLCGVAAIELLSTLLRRGKGAAVAQQIAREPANLVSLVASAERPETKPAHVVAILRLLLDLLCEPKTEKLVLSKVSESYFDKILASPLALTPQSLSGQSLAQAEVAKAIFCLLLLINFASIAKKAYLEKCCSLLEQPQLQYTLARGMASGNEQVVAAVLQIARFEHFPTSAVAKHLASINSGRLNCSSAAAEAAPQQQQQWYTLSSILKCHRTFINKELSQRVGSLVDNISGIVRRNELQSVPVSQVIELYNHRIDSLKSGMLSVQQRLEQANNQLIASTQLSNVQNAELEQFQTKNFELLISQERLQIQSKDLKQQTDKLKSNMSNLLKQLSENEDHLKASERRLAVKRSEVAGLRTDCEELKAKLSSKCEELTKLETFSKDSTSRIDKLKKSVLAYEQDIKEKMRGIEERDRELAKTHKSLEEQREGRKKSEDLVSVLETQLQEKKEQIEHLETELKETEDMRKTIMSLMESKKPKRKN
ncbi:uncharacterized protein LOC117890708 isoform X1 [Drosophila subobscura]|uniref:uncharacterized protein LOC117890708 isoform X1 n=1 Tax=Drosophila subobscura TaxID=7241 RepID=UPI00155AEB4F|nr:uncharacterized protein LOC117890708 isoform X1 [Drosophila subobscura]